VSGVDRRTLMAAGVLAAAGLGRTPAQAQALEEMDMATALKQVLGGRQAQAGKVVLDMPLAASSGNSVALKVTVDSPMTAADHVTRIHVFAEANPRPHLFTASLGPLSGRAEVATNIRLSRSETVWAFAETSDGGLWVASRSIDVTIGACDSLMFKY
jgi:sulfur-oxidizing protein SoxY